MEPIGTEILKKKPEFVVFFQKLYYPRVEHINLLKKHFLVNMTRVRQSNKIPQS